MCKFNWNGNRGLSCSKSAGRFSRHSEINNIIYRALQSANIPSIWEPLGLSRDATVADTLAPSYLHQSSLGGGRVAEQAASRNWSLYSNIVEQNYIFIPFACETLGPWCAKAIRSIDVLGHMLKLIKLKWTEIKSLLEAANKYRYTTR